MATTLGARERQASGAGADYAAEDRFLETSERDPLKHFRAFLRDNGEFCEKEWARAEENQKFAAGGIGQWADERAYNDRVASGRPTFTINDTELAVRALSGREVTARYEPKVVSENDDDADRCEVYSQFIKKKRAKANAAYVESDAYRDLCIENYSVIEIVQKFDGREPHGRTCLEHNFLWEHVWDRRSKMVNFMDRSADARGYLVSIDEYLMLFPQEKENIRERLASKANWVTENASSTWSAYRIQGQYISTDRSQIFLVSYHWREREPCYIATVPPGFAPHPIGEQTWAPVAQLLQQAGLPPLVGDFPGMAPWAQVQQVLQQAQQQGAPVDPKLLEIGAPRSIKMTEEEWAPFQEQYAQLAGAPPDAYGPEEGCFKWKFQEAMIVGNDIIRERRLPFRHFPRIYMASCPFKQADKIRHNSVVESMKDPARFKNLVVSATATMFTASQKRGIVLRENAFVDDSSAIETRMSQPFWFLTARAGLGNLSEAFEVIDGGGYPQGSDSFLELADQAVWRGTGMSPQTLGSPGDMRRISGKVFEGVQDAPAIVTSWENEALRNYKVVCAELMLDFTREYNDRQDVLDVVGASKAAAIPPEEEWELSFEFDCDVDEVPVTANQKQASWEFWSRQGSIEKWIQLGIMPPWLAPILLPDGWVEESYRTAWLRWMDQRGMGPNSPPPMPPGTDPNDPNAQGGQGGAPPAAPPS